MANILAELVAKITTDISGLKQGLGEAEKDMGSWVKNHEKQIKMAGAAMVGFGVAVTGALALATKAAIDEEININRLAIALKNVGVEYDDVKESLEAVITATQRKTGIADSAQRDALNQLLIVTGDYQKSLELLPLALDLAAAKGMDVENAATLLGRVMEGNTGILGRYGIQLKEGATASEALAAIQEKVAGAAEATANPINILKAEMSDLAESIGSALVPILKSLIDKIMPIIGGIQDWIKEHPELARVIIIGTAIIGGLSLAFGTLLLLLPTLNSALALFGISLTAALGPIGWIVLAIMGLIAIGTLLIANWDTVIGWAKTIGAAFVKFKDIIVDLAIRGINFLKERFEAIIAPFKKAWEWIKTLIGHSPGVLMLEEEMEELGKALPQTEFEKFIEDALKRLNPLIGATIDLTKGLITQFSLLANIIKTKIIESFAALNLVIDNTQSKVLNLINTLNEIPREIIIDIKQITTALQQAGGITGGGVSGEATYTVGGVSYTGAQLGAVGAAIGGGAAGAASYAATMAAWGGAHYQYGGIAWTPQLASIAETEPELITPFSKLGELGGVTVNNYFTEPVFFDREDSMNKFIDKIRAGINRADRLRFGRAYSGG